MNGTLLLNSLAVGVFTTGLSLFLGTMAALWICGLPCGLRKPFFCAAILALALPPFLVTNCWLHFLGRTGVWHRWLPLDIFSIGGTIWILSMGLWPLSLLFVWGAWQRLEPAQLESDMMVAGWALIRVLLFPLARAALAQAALITFVLALNNFAVPAILQVKVFPAEMWVRFNTTFDTVGALQLSWPLLLGPLLLLFWFAHRDVSWPHLQNPVSAALFRQQLGQVWFGAGGACCFFVCFCSVLVPLGQILSQPRTWSELPGALAAGQSAVWNSVFYAALGATVVVVAALWSLTLGLVRWPKREPGRTRAIPLEGQKAWLDFSSRLGRRLLLALAWLAFLLPGVLLGIGLIHAFNHSWSAWFYQSSGIVIFALAIRYLAIGWHGAKQAGKKVDSDLIDVARLEGATGWQLLRHVLWPQIARPVVATWYVIFLLCLWDVESILMVVPPGGETLALRIFNLLHYGHNAQVNALCFVLLVVALLPLVLERLLSLIRFPTFRILVLAGTMALTQTSCSPSAGDASLQSRFFGRVQIIGSRGVGVGQLNKPRSVAVDLADNMYVVDMTGRIQKFSTNGTFLLSWQMPQIERGKPKGMCHDLAGNILVVEPHYSRVNIFSTTGKLLSQWGSHGTNDGELSLPRGVAVNSSGVLFVSEYEEAEKVQRYEFGPGGLMGALHAATGGLCKPQWTGGFGHAGTGPGEFNRPEGICVDAQDRIYVADSCNHRIQIFSSEGKFLRAYGKAGKGLGELSYPYDICVDKAGRQYVCEFGNSRLQIFDANDQPLEIIGSPGAEPGRFNNPWSIALDSAGNLYVADSQNHRVQKLIRRE